MRRNVRLARKFPNAARPLRPRYTGSIFDTMFARAVGMLERRNVNRDADSAAHPSEIAAEVG